MTQKEKKLKYCKMVFSKPMPECLRTFENSNPDIVEIVFGWIDAVDRDATVKKEREHYCSYGWNFVRFHAVPTPPPYQSR